MKRWVAIVAAVLVPGAAYGQDPLPGWPGLDLSRLSTVYVVAVTGEQTTGTLLRLDRDSLTLLSDGAERRFEAARVRRIDRRGDSLRNGAIIGAVVGAVLGGLVVGASDCPGSVPGGRCLGARVGLAIMSTGVYAAMGTALDALVVGRTTLYEAPGGRPSSAHEDSGRVTHGRRAALNLRFSW
ncbi:MAG TPA: hypothetical protein VMM93_10340 [Vicinamibacterales bacterium]|nr:hypothetical protein [Vicinamibacterales bacterium]